jgi:hypothetical protein
LIGLGKRITIVTGQHLISNPRVWKEANVLAANGYIVSIYTTWHSEKKYQDDLKLIHSSIGYHAGFSLIDNGKNTLLVFIARLMRKLANLSFLMFKIPSIYQEVYMPFLQLRVIAREQTDLFIAHQETGLILGVMLLKMGRKVAFDFEDWYASDYPNKYRPVGLLTTYETMALNSACYVSCPSKSMADAIGFHYNTTKSLSVIYNSFHIDNNKSISTKKIPNSMVWFSQTIGTGRGIEAYMELMKKVSVPVELHFIGYSSLSYIKFLNDLLKGTPHILHVHPPMEHDKMLQFVAQFAFGLALENAYPQSRHLTITNKILVYLQFGLRVIATPTQGHLELQKQFPASITYIQQNDEVNSVEAIDQLLSVTPLQEACDMGQYAWIEQEKNILALVDNAIHS